MLGFHLHGKCYNDVNKALKRCIDHRLSIRDQWWIILKSSWPVVTFVRGVGVITALIVCVISKITVPTLCG